jgi:phosphopantetheine--protein transferase-like protein
MAIAAEPGRGVGIDVERVDRRRGEFERAAFSPKEMRLLEEGPEAARRERALRLWCAKEAVAKAIGRGLMGSPLNLEALGTDPGLGRVDLRLTGSLATALPHLGTSILTAYVDREGDLIVATAHSDA